MLILALVATSIIMFAVRKYGDGGEVSSDPISQSESIISSEPSSAVPSKPAPETVLDSGRNFNANIKGVPVLMYHNLVPDDSKKNGRYSNNSITTALSEFEEQMELLFNHGYETINCDTLIDFINGEAEVPEKCFLITFDDGYKCVPKFAADILRKFGFEATVFVFTGELDKEIEEYTSEDLQYLRREELNATDDVFSFQCHLDAWKTHNAVESLSLEDIESSIDTSLSQLKTEYFAYPLGHYTSAYTNMIKDKGFKGAFTIEKGYAKKGTDPYLIPRFTVVHRTPAEQILSLIETGNRYN